MAGNTISNELREALHELVLDPHDEFHACAVADLARKELFNPCANCGRIEDEGHDYYCQYHPWRHP